LGEQSVDSQSERLRNLEQSQESGGDLGLHSCFLGKATARERSAILVGDGRPSCGDRGLLYSNLPVEAIVCIGGVPIILL